PRAAPKLWPCLSWRRNFCGDDHAHHPRVHPTGDAAGIRNAVRLGSSAKAGHAEGRDPRFLTIILRGALDGLATVAPVGDPDWVALRGDNALTLEGKTPAFKLNDFFALNPAMPPTCIGYSRPIRQSSFTPARRPTASARISMDRTCSRAGLPSPLPATPAGL